MRGREGECKRQGKRLRIADFGLRIEKQPRLRPTGFAVASGTAVFALAGPVGGG